MTQPPRSLDPSLGLQTRLVHGGEDGENSAIPIYQANTVGDGYSRFDNPTIKAFEARFAQLEGGVCTLATATGMAAISVTLLSMARAGEHILVHRSGFIGTDGLLGLLPRWGIAVRRVDMRDMQALSEALRERPALVYFEVLSNPAMELIDAPAVIALTQEHEVPVVVDNTLLTPVNFRPLHHGASVVVHSASKYIGGHGDALGGLISTSSQALASTLSDVRRLTGGTISPMNAYLLARSLPTLPDRMARHAANALALAEFLAEHPAILRVDYLGLKTWPDHEVGARFLDGFGGVFSVVLQPGHSPAQVSEALRLCRRWYSFGDMATLVRAHDREPTKLRISAGLEDVTDLIADLEQAFLSTQV